MLDQIFSFSNFITVADIALVAFLLYWFMLMFKGTRAERMLWGIGVIIIVYFVSQRAELLTLHWILSNFLGSIAIFLIVVFQQDIRKALIHMGKPFSTRDVAASRESLEEITRAAASMSKTRTGGIVVIERGIDLADFLDVGVEIDAKLSKELILSIFNTSSPMHDGAVVVRAGRIFKAGCILPLTEKELTKSMGTRHRAAIGLSEETDAAIIVVSEETGEITLVVEDALYVDLGPDRLLNDLKKLLTGKGYRKKSIIPWREGN
ncbi:MAG: TIGR00159 family protein [Deltaproteobacteria bacterium GWB2_55_19]|nr:MAG: TIGR00159 family protein [Deltaproteobacteria bacterium GWB2_55_19]HAO93905.1 TIGR00159 family protein [Deltaproteobacteria bacterium]